jgi:hypothetical protein
MTHRITPARQAKVEILTAIEAHKKIKEKHKIIIRRVLNGETYKSVGADYGICSERVRGICFCTFRQKLGLKL